MKRSLLLTVLPFLWMLPVSAVENSRPELGDLTLLDGQKLEQVKVLKIEPDGLRVEHRNGMGKLKLEILPSAIVERFKLSETAAAEWRGADKKRAEENSDREREAEVKIVRETPRADQDEQVRRQRLALYDSLRTGNFSFVDIDDDLRRSVSLFKEAGRGDLAAMLEEDRQLLKQREISRPAADLEAQKQEMANRVSQLESDLAASRNQPPAPVNSFPLTSYRNNSYLDSGFYTPSIYLGSSYYYNNRPDYYNHGPVVRPPLCPPNYPITGPLATRPHGLPIWTPRGNTPITRPQSSYPIATPRGSYPITRPPAAGQPGFPVNRPPAAVHPKFPNNGRPAAGQQGFPVRRPPVMTPPRSIRPIPPTGRPAASVNRGTSIQRAPGYRKN